MKALFNPNQNRPKAGDKTSDNKATEGMEADRDSRPEQKNGKDGAKPKSAPGQPMRLNN